jgi:predicted nucleotidyltransferase
MSKEKILKEYYNSIVYTEEMWELLNSKRKRAITLLEMFKKLNPFVYGSIARGDVNEKSDIDIIFLNQIPTFQIELILNENGLENYAREILMATPQDSIKLYIYLNEYESLTVPLTKLDKKVLEFYDFGGKISLSQLQNNTRVPGIDKRLVFIKPNSKGHEEYSITNQENVAAKDLGIRIETIMERKKVLLKREKHGRTGVFLKKELGKEDSVEMILKNLADRKSIIRKKLFQR